MEQLQGHGKCVRWCSWRSLWCFYARVLISFLPVFLLPVLGDLGFAGSTFSDADFGLSGIFLGVLAKNGGILTVSVGIFLVLALMLGLSLVKKNRKKDNMTSGTADLKRFAKEIRYHTLATLNQLGFGHYGGSLSIVEVLAALYGEILDIRVQNFSSKEQDHFILSKGHAGPALYSTLYLKGFFDRDFLLSLNQMEHICLHTDRNLTPGWI